ncbi:hypothetical protein GSI_03213 [Ganoderma sinense ZZ0214-1]|uniref:Uncharacterized protein n=1 Tax=Ganoderma sinense ZZ0214-1 TaxID=1077348 RepID=A0A2G8SL03_9APHY|nr:hypothetical protein GSI_03213 [Ganoderma sinense ZZ0214-1]
MPSASASTKPPAAEKPVANPPLELQQLVTEEGRFVDIPIELLRQPPPKPSEFLYFQQYLASAPPLRQDLKKCKTTEDAIDILATELETMHALVAGYVKSLCTATARFDEDIAKVHEQHASLQTNFFFCQNLLLHTHQVLSQLQYGYTLLKAKVELKVSQHAGLKKLPVVKASNGRKHLVSDPEMTIRQKARNQDHLNRMLTTKADAAAVQGTEAYGLEKAMVDELAHPQLHPPKSSGKGKGKGIDKGPLFEPHVRVKVEKLAQGLETMRETFMRVEAKTDREFENLRFQIAGATKDTTEFWRLHDDMSNKASLDQGEWIKHLKRTHTAYTAWAERPAPVNTAAPPTTGTFKLAESRPSSAAYPTPSSSQTPESDAGPSQDTAAPQTPQVDLPFDPRTSAYAIHISVNHDKPVDELTRDEAIAMLKALPQRFELVPQAAIAAFETEQKLAYFIRKEGEVKTSLEVLAEKLEEETGIRAHPEAALPPIVPEKRTEVYGEPFPADAQGTGPVGTSTPAAKSSSVRARPSVDHTTIPDSSVGVSDGKGKSRKREREPAVDQLLENGVEAEGLPERKMKSQKNKRVRRA